MKQGWFSSLDACSVHEHVCFCYGLIVQAYTLAKHKRETEKKMIFAFLAILLLTPTFQY